LGLSPRHDGTAQCILGFLDGFAALDQAADIDVWVLRDAAKFHSLARRYPAFRQLHELPDGEYFAAVCLTHTWSLSIVAALHKHALVLAFTMLDTIGWDVLYTPGAATVGAVWRFIARHADGLLYISQFTRERFKTRFPLHPRVTERVTHLSLVADELLDPAALTQSVSEQILVFGNDLDHKAVRPTASLLADAFPFNKIVAFGIADSVAPNVTAIPSGQLERAQLHKLVAEARVIVFPSFYEGFGLPVVEGLAYGRPVIVRRSALWREVAAWSRLPGQLIEFDDPPSLVEAVGRVLAGLPVGSLPSSGELAVDAAPAGWRECAQRVLGLVDDCVSAIDGAHWRERDEALQLAGV
jgi:glycosyltransferase involved in cell wall biosynthesis